MPAPRELFLHPSCSKRAVFASLLADDAFATMSRVAEFGIGGAAGYLGEARAANIAPRPRPCAARAPPTPYYL